MWIRRDGTRRLLLGCLLVHRDRLVVVEKAEGFGLLREVVAPPRAGGFAQARDRQQVGLVECSRVELLTSTMPLRSGRLT